MSALTTSKSAPSAHGADTISLPSCGLLPSDMKVTVALPESYRAPADTAHYPVVYLLNGHGGNYRNWSTIIDIDSLATAYSTIIICPSGMDSWYWDSPIEPDMKMETFIVSRLVPAIDSLYRTRPERSQRAITGFSMGGHGALWLALRHPELFGSVGSSSGGVNIEPFKKNWNLEQHLGSYSSNPSRWRSHTVINQLDQLQPDQFNIIFDCGTSDFFYGVNCDLDSALNARRIPHTYITGPGAHNKNYWKGAIVPQMDFFRYHRDH